MHTNSPRAAPRGPIRKASQRLAAALLACVAAGFLGPVGAATDGAAALSGAAGHAVAPAEPVHRAAATGPGRGTAQAGLDRRLALLTRELDLDADQQVAMRRLLLLQREQTLKVWSDDTVPSAVRIKATQGVADRTAEQIRLMLNDGQRVRYQQPRSREAEQHLASGDLESWMRGSAPSAMPAPQE